VPRSQVFTVRGAYSFSKVKALKSITEYEVPLFTMTLLFRVDLFTIPADVLLLECWLSRLFASTRVFRCGKF